MKPMTFVHTELHTTDPNRAQHFYSDLFGWEFLEMPSFTPSYRLIQAAGERVGAVSEQSGGHSHWLCCVGVSDVVATTRRARALGASVELDAQSFGDIGTLSVLADPTGARFALWQPASRELVRNEWGVIVEDHGLIELRWLPSTSGMTDGGFMATLCLFASEAEKARPKALLIDATDFRHEFGPGLMEWRDAHIIPRYGAAGVRRFAFLMPAGFARDGMEATEGPAVFPTKWFVDRRAALDWLRATSA
jgi:predicted enzyme related to lactoylglutathione lyase